MGRWRAPSKPGTPYITAGGFRALEDELKNLWPRRRDVVKALADAAAEGDRSENAEYVYRKKELAGIDRRIRYLERRLPQLKVIAPVAGRDKIYFGATVTLIADDGGALILTLVGPDEANAGDGRISIDAPLARSLLGLSVGDNVRLADETQYSVESVSYEIQRAP